MQGSLFRARYKDNTRIQTNTHQPSRTNSCSCVGPNECATIRLFCIRGWACSVFTVHTCSYLSVFMLGTRRGWRLMRKKVTNDNKRKLSLMKQTQKKIYIRSVLRERDGMSSREYLYVKVSLFGCGPDSIAISKWSFLPEVPDDKNALLTADMQANLNIYSFVPPF